MTANNNSNNAKKKKVAGPLLPPGASRSVPHSPAANNNNHNENIRNPREFCILKEKWSTIRNFRTKFASHVSATVAYQTEINTLTPESIRKLHQRLVDLQVFCLASPSVPQVHKFYWGPIAEQGWPK